MKENGRQSVMNTKKRNPRNTELLVSEIRELILSARNFVSRNVNLLQVMTNFEIGRRIVEHEQRGHIRATYGKEVLKELSDRLAGEFGRGFSRSNLEYMRKFYVMYRSRLPEKSQMPSGKLFKNKKPASNVVQPPLQYRQYMATTSPFALSWSQYVFLMSIKDVGARNFYEIEAAANNWTLPELSRQCDACLYERLALSRNKKAVRNLSRKGHVVAKADDLLKEPYVLEFLGLEEQAKYSETDLESAIIDKLDRFLRELGKGFLFEARQKRFTFDEEHFFIDLVFYNRLLHCYVLIDLKIGKLTHQDLGQMQMYVNYYDRHVKTGDEKPTVGIILCKKKHDALVEITLPKAVNIFAKRYQLYLPTKEELRQKLLDWTEKNATAQ